jgi:ABC-type Fe3+-hydroxamate transport system substrate-binding protein
MRFISVILLVFLSGCTLLSSQEPDNEAKKEQEFQDLMKKSKEMQAASREAIKIADKKADSVVIKTNQKIITLTKIVYVLKEVNHELKAKVDSIVNDDPGEPFDLLAVPGDKDHW